MAVDFLKVEKILNFNPHDMLSTQNFRERLMGIFSKIFSRKNSNFEEKSKLIGSIRRSATHNHIELNLFHKTFNVNIAKSVKSYLKT